MVFNMGQVLQLLVPHRELPGISCARDVRVACASKSLRFFGHLKAIIGGKLKIAFRHYEIRKVIWWRLVVRAEKFMLG